MAEPRIVVASPSFSSNPVLRRNLSAIFQDVKYNDTGKPVPRDELIAFMAGAEGAITGLDVINDPLLAALPELRIIAKYGVGLDMIDTDALRTRGVVLGWTSGVNRRSVSELALCFMIGLCRNVLASGHALKCGNEWLKKGGFQLSGKTVGIIGFGHIGQDVARLLAPFECRLLVNDMLDMGEACARLGASQVSFDELLAGADVVTLHVPLDISTRHMMNARAFAMMKPGAYLINTARGGVVAQKDLFEALRGGRLAGAAIDVFEEEPLADRELLGLPNLFGTAHIGGNAIEAVHAMGNSAIGHLREYFKK